MARNGRSSAIIDGILKLMVFSGSLTAALIAPNIVQVLDKPTLRYLDKLDKRSRQRELRRTLYYMKQQQLIAGDYEHGLKITGAGMERLQKLDIETLKIKKPARWDHKWRMVLYDIPERHKAGRNALTAKLKELGFYQLQRSVWIYPFPCRNEVEAVTSAFEVNPYVSYIETTFIDQQKLLINKFKFLKLV